MKAKKTTKKTTARPASALASAPKTKGTARTAVKVLRGGESWHGGSHRWSLPTQGKNGAWTPGEWAPVRDPILCSKGWHLTHDPGRWWGDNVVAYLAEYDGPTDGPDPKSEDDPTKFAATRARLLRPLTAAEIEANGIYLSGEHDVVLTGRIVLGGTAHFKGVGGSARVDSMYGSARVDSMYDSARVDSMYDSARVDSMCGSARVGSMEGSARVDRMEGSARVDRMDDSASVGSMEGSARVGSMDDSASVGSMYDSASVGSMEGSATAHANGAAVVVLRDGTPTVTLRGRASCLDYRSERPVAHFAPKRGVLTLNADGTIRTEGT
jgi:hypothetical protein